MSRTIDPVEARLDAAAHEIDPARAKLRRLRATAAPALIGPIQAELDRLEAAIGATDADAADTATAALRAAFAHAEAPESTPAGLASESPLAMAGPVEPARETSPPAPAGTNPPSPLDYALAYAALGWHLLPVDTKTKHPLSGLGIKHASMDADAIREWFKRWPRAGIGIYLAASGLCAVDIDPRNGSTKAPADFPATLTAQTGGGGYHLIYRVPAGVALPGTLGPGIDIKWRGYVIVEPSLHLSGRRYSWVEFDPLTAALVGGPDIAAFPVELLTTQTPNASEPARAENGAVVEGGRNEHLSREAFRLRKQGLLPDAILPVIRAINCAVCSPPLDEDEVRTIAEGKAGIESEATEVASTFENLGPDPDVRSEPKAGRFRVLTFSEFKKRPAPEWIIKGVLPRAELVLIIGVSGSGKSFFALDLVAAAARGAEWRGKKVKCPLRAVYVAAEGTGGFRNRIEAYARHHGLDDLGIGIIPDAPSFLQRADVKALIQEIRAFGAVDLIVVDTWAQVTAGGDENSGQDMGKALGHCKAIHRETGATVILIHHLGKDATRGARGWSGLKAAADAEIEITRNDTQRLATVTKLKDGADGAVYPFRLEVIPIGIDNDGDVIDSCVIEHQEGVKVTRRDPTGKHEKTVLHVLNDLSALAEDRGIPVGELLDEAVSKMPRDPTKRDRRREYAGEALQALTAGHWIDIRDNRCFKGEE